MLKIEGLVRALEEARVEFVVIGGIAALAYGSATVTNDFDVTAPFTAENFERLLGALAPYRPRYALTPDKRPVHHSPEELSHFNNVYLLTDIGRIDVLKHVEPLGAFDQLARRAETLVLYGRPIKVLALDDLIAVKAHLGRPKDKLVEAELRAIRAKLRAKQP